MRFAFTLTILCALTACQAAQGVMAADMLHMSVKVVEPKMPANAWIAKPKEYWVSGTSKGRVAEALNQEQNVQPLTIMAPPDIWQVDLVSHKGTHVIADAKKDLHFPIFGGRAGNAESAKVLKTLEFGHELEWFKAHNAKKSTRKEKGADIDVYEVTLAPVTTELDVDAKTQKPVQVSLRHDKEKLALQYVAYETLPFQDSKFTPPAGIEFKTMTAAEVEKKRMEFRGKVLAKIKEMEKNLEAQRTKLEAEQKNAKTNNSKTAGDKTAADKNASKAPAKATAEAHSGKTAKP